MAAAASAVLALLAVGCGQESPQTMKLMSYNIRTGRGLDGNYDLQRIADIIKAQDPDFVGLQEIDSVAKRSGLIDEAAELGRLTGMHACYAGAIPYSEGKYGIAVLTKEEPLSVRRIPLPGAEEARTSIFIEYPDLVLINTHFSLREMSRQESVAILTAAAREYSKPAVICGDFNMQPGSKSCTMMEEEWLALSDTTLRTYPADAPEVTIDYFWGLKGSEYIVSKYVVLEEPVASDHRPLVLNVEIAD